MQYRKYAVVLTGQSPLLMHSDNVEWSDKMKAYQKNPLNKGKSIAGDDRTPAFTWLGYLYEDSGKVSIPADNIMSLLREGGAKVPKGKKNMTFMRQSQSGIIVDQSGWDLICNGLPISHKKIMDALENEEDFEKHKQMAQDMGFELFVKRATIGTSKHVRVRPRFDNWSCSGTVTVFDDEITTDIIEQIFMLGGAYCGMGDWRPSSKKPGSFGKFSAEVKEIK